MDGREGEEIGYENAWAALRMIRETLEELGPGGALMASEEVMHRYGPEPVHEAQAICEALARIPTGSTAVNDAEQRE
jgi:hypothetical protein